MHKLNQLMFVAVMAEYCLYSGIAAESDTLSRNVAASRGVLGIYKDKTNVK